MTINEVEKIKKVVENKDYIVQLVNIVAKTLIEAFENLKIEDVNMFQLGYNKAIDDFVKAIVDRGLSANDDKYCITHYDNYLKVIKEIAEQLKEGVKWNIKRR